MMIARDACPGRLPVGRGLQGPVRRTRPEQCVEFRRGKRERTVANYRNRLFHGQERGRPVQGLLIVPSPSGGGLGWGRSIVSISQHFTLTPALSLKGEGELKDPRGRSDSLIAFRPQFPAVSRRRHAWRGSWSRPWVSQVGCRTPAKLRPRRHRNRLSAPGSRGMCRTPRSHQSRS